MFIRTYSLKVIVTLQANLTAKELFRFKYNIVLKV